MDSSPIALNAEQQRAATHPGGPLLVQAGPGTGKTRTLTSRIAYLIKEKKISPGSILALTFTHRAAREMRERLEAILGESLPDRTFIGTFHALGFDIVRSEWQKLGFSGRPTLYDEEEILDLIREIEEKKDLGPRRTTLQKAVKAGLRRAEAGKADTSGHPGLSEFLTRFEERKRSENAVDFDDLIRLPLRLLREDTGFRAACRNRWRHILVDEYQDVNAEQAELIRHLGAEADSVLAIGDPDQAIYSFRGSDSASFLTFEKEFPGAEVVFLKANYRSTVTILKASSEVIKHNRFRPKSAPTPASLGDDGVRLAIHTLGSDKGEALFVTSRIEELVGGIGRYGLEESASGQENRIDADPFSFADIAVLFRLNAQAREIVGAFEKSGIPCQLAGTSRSKLDPRERALFGLARMAHSPDDPAAARSLKIVPAGARKSLLAAWRTVDRSRLPAGELLSSAADLAARTRPGEAEAWIKARERLISSALSSGRDRSDFLASAPLALREEPYDFRAEKVTLSTLHSAKGLEFPVVFITGMERDLIPFIRDDDDDPAAALEEERRLLYVGMTRARSRLFLTRARRRFLFGRTRECGPSPFLQEISEDLLRFVRQGAKGKKRSGGRRKGESDENGNQMTLF